MKKVFLLPVVSLLRLLLILLVVFVVSCTPAEPPVPAEKQCQMDNDCVPAACCHPADAVNKAYAPDCQGIFCTMECAPDTLDCGQGKIKCLEGECLAVVSK